MLLNTPFRIWQFSFEVCILHASKTNRIFSLTSHNSYCKPATSLSLSLIHSNLSFSCILCKIDMPGLCFHKFVCNSDSNSSDQFSQFFVLICFIRFAYFVSNVSIDFNEKRLNLFEILRFCTRASFMASLCEK